MIGFIQMLCLTVLAFMFLPLIIIGWVYEKIFKDPEDKTIWIFAVLTVLGQIGWFNFLYDKETSFLCLNPIVAIWTNILVIVIPIIILIVTIFFIEKEPVDDDYDD